MESRNGLDDWRLTLFSPPDGIVGDEDRRPVSTLLTVFVWFAIKWHIDFHKGGI